MKIYLKSGEVKDVSFSDKDFIQEVVKSFGFDNVDVPRTFEYYKKNYNDKSKFLMVVDDDPMITTSLEGYATIAKCVCVKAEDTEDAYALWKKYPSLDVVITDLNMPGMSGIEFSKIIKDLDDSIKVILLTGDEEAIQLEDSLDLLLKKPIPFSQFLTSVIGL